MKSKIVNIANAVTFLRVIFVFYAAYLILSDGVFNKIVALILTILIFIMDYIDGVIARLLKCETGFGAVLDIAGDRIIENTYWIVFAYLRLIPLWIPIVVLTRGLLTDAIRAAKLKEGKTPFGKKTMMKSELTRFLTSSRLMRGFYGILKLIVFSYLTMLTFLPEFLSFLQLSSTLSAPLANIGFYLSILTVIIMIIRGIPVIVDGI